MSQDKQSDQSHIIGEMFDAANISQPVSPQGLQGNLNPDNIPMPTPPSMKSSFTVDNISVPIVTEELNQENNNG